MKDLNKARTHLVKCDKALACWIRKSSIRPNKSSEQSPYERLARAIVGQQISVAAAQTIWSRFCGLFEGDKIDFHRLQRLDPLTLRSVGLSKQKIVYVQDLASKVTSECVPHPKSLTKLSDEEIMQALLPIKGVGEWTIQMLLIFHLQRPDVWPVKDLGMKKGFMRVHNRRKIPEEKFLHKFGERFRPYRSYAALYYWNALDSD